MRYDYKKNRGFFAFDPFRPLRRVFIVILFLAGVMECNKYNHRNDAPGTQQRFSIQLKNDK